ncbi:MAG: terpene cyclase/mutase family protein, partial [Planctomycetales bacterium]|nr:terpene cyclase/mutase family protein [Planctomycetales bacterium]
SLAAVAGGAALVDAGAPRAAAGDMDPKVSASIRKGLDWVAREQARRGHWTAGGYPTAMTALAGTALLMSGSTTTQGPYRKNISFAVDYLIGQAAKRVGDNLVPRFDGLIGDPFSDNRYTYGHGFSMLFLSQVLGEEEDEARRDELIQVLEKAVDFSGKAQTKSGGWGYVSAEAGNNFDEGSTTITQVQGLRGCRNAGIIVPKEIIDNAVEYIYGCKNPDGGISYSSRNKGTSRPAITAAALAGLYNAGDYKSEESKEMLEYCRKNLFDLGGGANSFGHWHYTYLYYTQVVYREGGSAWETFRDKLCAKIVGEQDGDGKWSGNIGPIYITACNLIMLQLNLATLPIYQR